MFLFDYIVLIELIQSYHYISTTNDSDGVAPTHFNRAQILNRSTAILYFQSPYHPVFSLLLQYAIFECVVSRSNQVVNQLQMKVSAMSTMSQSYFILWENVLSHINWKAVCNDILSFTISSLFIVLKRYFANFHWNLIAPIKNLYSECSLGFQHEKLFAIAEDNKVLMNAFINAIEILCIFRPKHLVVQNLQISCQNVLRFQKAAIKLLCWNSWTDIRAILNLDILRK